MGGRRGLGDPNRRSGEGVEGNRGEAERMERDSQNVGFLEISEVTSLWIPTKEGQLT